MPDFSSVLGFSQPFPFEALPAWEGVLETFRKGAVPHCWAIKAPLEWHEGLLKVISGLFMCNSGSGCGVCAGCRGWGRADEKGVSSHPDVTVMGEFDKACNIEACRVMIKELCIKPALAARRLGVLLAADKLLAGAANSLLKIAEEPPSHACLLFLMEGDDFLPTLRSRSRLTVLASLPAFAASPMPGDEAQWAERLGNFKDNEDITGLLSSWTSYFLQAGKIRTAARIDRLRLLILQKKLSQNMICDLLILTLKEELPFEPIFDGIW